MTIDPERDAIANRARLSPVLHRTPKTAGKDALIVGQTWKLRIENGAREAGILDTDAVIASADAMIGSDESDIAKGLLSITAPLARALIGKSVGDSVEVVTPRGSKSYEIVKIRFV